METAPLIFFAIMAIFMIFGYFVFYRGNNASLKRRIFPIWIVLGYAAFVAFLLSSWALDLHDYGNWLYRVLPVVGVAILIGAINIRVTKFCDQCGSMAVPNGGFRPLASCPKCGAALK